jgi:hypothetical protein
MKYLLLGIVLGAIALFSVPSQAALSPAVIDWVLPTTYTRHGRVIYVKINSKLIQQCFPIYLDDLNALPEREWKYLIDAAQNPKPTTLVDTQVCTDTLPPPSWKVATNLAATDTPPTRPLGKFRILVGAPCENETVKLSTGGKEWHYATNATGYRDITVCEKK